MAPDLTMTPVLEKLEGKQFNSPNDAVYRSDGALKAIVKDLSLPNGIALSLEGGFPGQCISVRG